MGACFLPPFLCLPEPRAERTREDFSDEPWGGLGNLVTAGGGSGKAFKNSNRVLGSQAKPHMDGGALKA